MTTRRLGNSRGEGVYKIKKKSQPERREGNQKTMVSQWVSARPGEVAIPNVKDVDNE